MRKFSVSITERINLGRYEFMEVSGSVEFEDDDMGKGDTPETYGTRELDVLLRSHRRRAQGLVPEDIESFMLVHPALEN
ncbi:hypothetical protein ACFYP4_02750 [Streptomyces sp. NPDC005551]|uniref:hypothetical protein n=1 Tax=Streptomyces sp. NPDC005551 TaxID=3364725 RepID=UPI0036A61CA8